VQLVGHRVDVANPAALDACQRAAQDAHRRALAYAAGSGVRITDLAWAREPARTEFFASGPRAMVAQSIERGGAVEASSHIDLSGDILTITVELEAAFHFEPVAPEPEPSVFGLEAADEAGPSAPVAGTADATGAGDGGAGEPGGTSSTAAGSTPASADAPRAATAWSRIDPPPPPFARPAPRGQVSSE
jgi:hypothetical protein